MSNAKEEFIEKFKDEIIENAVIWFNNDYREENTKYFILNEGYSHEQYIEFLNELDFNYDDGYGGQELFGFVGLGDGKWAERGEYDGSEWWEIKEKPNIQEIIKNKMLEVIEK